MKALAVFGRGGPGGVVKDIAELVRWEAITFLDKNRIYDDTPGSMNLNSFDGLIEFSAEFDAAFMATGDNKTRFSKIRTLMSLDVADEILVNPRSAVSKTVQLQAGTLICAGRLFQNDVLMGIGLIVNTNATVEHDVVIGYEMHISQSACICGSA